MKSKFWMIVLAVLLALFAAGPYITAYEMKADLEARDGEQFAKHVDFPPLRQGLKDQLNDVLAKEMSGGETSAGFEAIGTMLGNAVIDKLVDACVTPTAFAKLSRGAAIPPMEGKPETEPKGESDFEPFRNASMGYKGLSKFQIAVPLENGEGDVRFILRRRGIGWKLTDLIIPWPD